MKKNGKKGNQINSNLNSLPVLDSTERRPRRRLLDGREAEAGGGGRRLSLFSPPSPQFFFGKTRTEEKGTITVQL